MDDCISRQAAIELIHSLYPSAPIMRINRKRWEKKYKPYIEAEKALEQLPSAQPKPCDDPRADIYYLAEKIGIHRLYALVVELRGEPDPCEDTTSRQQAITALRALSDGIPDDDWFCGNAERRENG